jgi:hypothetical protein
MREIWEDLMREVEEVVASGVMSRADAMACAEEDYGWYLAEAAAIADKDPEGRPDARG